MMVRSCSLIVQNVYTLNRSYIMKRKNILMVLSTLILVVYMLLTDPYSDNSLLDNIPYGIQLVFLVKVLILSLALITMMSYLVDTLTDKSYGVDEKVLVDKAMDTPSGAGYIMISRAIIFLAGAIIILGVLLYTRGN